MWLCIEELKKILKSRLSIIFLMLITSIQIIAVITSYKEIEKKCGSIPEYNAYANEYNGTLEVGIVKYDDIKKMSMDSYKREGNTKEEYFYEQYLAAIVRSLNYTNNGMGNPPVFQNAIGINILVQNVTSVFSVIFAFIGILISLYPIFSRDVENGMDSIIYSSYIGRKSIVKAKIVACLLFVIGWITVYYFSITIFTIFLFDNKNVMAVPINCIACLGDCSVNINVLQFLGLGYLLLLVSSLFISACIMIIYSRVKRQILGMVLGMALIIFPMFMPKNGNIGRIFCILPSAFGSALLIIGKNLKYVFCGAEISIVAFGMAIIQFTTIVLFMLFKYTFWKGRIEA